MSDVVGLEEMLEDYIPGMETEIDVGELNHIEEEMDESIDEIGDLAEDSGETEVIAQQGDISQLEEVPLKSEDDLSVQPESDTFEEEESVIETFIESKPTMSKSSSQQDWVSMDISKFGKSFYNGEENPLNEQIKRLKLKSLNQFLHNHQTEEIIEYSRSTDGLINNDVRRKIWPILLRMEQNIDFEATFIDDLSLHDKECHKDEDQIKLDIKRSFTHWTLDSDDIEILKKQLHFLVTKFFRKYPSLNYYQGFHDIASIVLLVCYTKEQKTVDELLAFKILECLTLNHLRDFLISDIHLSLQHLKLIPTLLEIIDHKFFKVLKKVNNFYVTSDGAYYDYSFHQGLSSILTMFSHDIDDLNQLLIIWDFILSYNTSIITIYIYVSFLQFKRNDIFEKLGLHEDDKSDAIDEIDKDLLHNLLSANNLFKDLTDNGLIKILNNAKYYYENYPINNLSNSTFTYDLWFKEYNYHSVLLTTSTSPFEVPRNLDLIDNPDKVDDVVKCQDDEMGKLQLYNLTLENKVFEIDSDYTNSLSGSLSSSVSSLQSSTTTLNSKILKTSSIYFKKLFKSDNDEPHPHVFKLSMIYKISLTVGFLSVLLHLLLSKHNSSILQYSNRFLNEGVSYFRNNGFNIGLGNIRSSIYGWMSKSVIGI